MREAASPAREMLSPVSPRGIAEMYSSHTCTRHIPVLDLIPSHVDYSRLHALYCTSRSLGRHILSQPSNIGKGCAFQFLLVPMDR